MSVQQTINDAGDADLLTRVGIALTLRLRHTLRSIHVSVDNGVVTLRGVLPTFYDRQLAIEITRHVAGVLQVKDELTVVSPNAAANRAVGEHHRKAATYALRGAGTESARRASDAVQRLERPALGWRSFIATAATVVRGMFLVVAVLLAVGCGQAAKEAPVAVHPAKGTITFKGQPIPGAMLTLHPKTEIAEVPKPRANVGKDGAFHLTTFAGNDGAPEGEYTVTIVWYKPIKHGNDVQAGPNVIPKKYTAPQTSDLQVRIAAGENNLPAIQL